MIPKARFAVAALLTTAMACSSNPVDLTIEEHGSFTLSLAQTEPGANARAASFLSAAAGNVALESVSSIDLTITQVQALRVGAGDGEDGEDGDNAAGWVTIDLGGPVSLNLLALPTTAEGAIELSGDLEVGLYRNIRLIVSDATITFNSDVSIGGGPVAVTYNAGTAYELRIPGPPGGTMRLLVPTAMFEVSAETTAGVALVFDGGTSVASLVATPQFLLIAPVLLAVGENDDVEA